MKLVNKILLEATYEKDKEQTDKVNELINQIDLIIRLYDGRNNENRSLFIQSNSFYIEFEELIVIFFDEYSDSPFAKNAKNEAIGRFYNKLVPPQIHIYECQIDFNIKTKEITKFSYDNKALFHELIHFFDFKRLKGKLDTSSVSKKASLEYYNHPLEFNAYFNELVTPEIKNITSNKVFIKQVKDQGWNKFKDNLLSLEKIKEYYNKLTTHYQTKFLKRLAQYYQKIIKMS